MFLIDLDALPLVRRGGPRRRPPCVRVWLAGAGRGGAPPAQGPEASGGLAPKPPQGAAEELGGAGGVQCSLNPYLTSPFSEMLLPLAMSTP